MISTDLASHFREKVCREVDVEPCGADRYVVHTPFLFDDGDHFVVIMRREGDRWVLTDEGHTLMHLSYQGDDVEQGRRGRLIERALAAHGIANDAGEFRLTVTHDAFGDALFSFVQGLTRVSDVAQWRREASRSTFSENFRSLIEAAAPAPRRMFDYRDDEVDPDGIYAMDCVITAPKRPWFIYAIGGTDRCRNATISIMHYERAGRTFNSMAIFRDQADVNRRAVAQLSDVVDKQFSSLGSRTLIEAFIKRKILDSAA